MSRNYAESLRLSITQIRPGLPITVVLPGPTGRLTKHVKCVTIGTAIDAGEGYMTFPVLIDGEPRMVETNLVYLQP